MRLKVKFLKLEAGRPIAILHKNLALKASIHVDERIYIEKNGKKIAAVVDLASGLLKENEIALSSDIRKFIELEEGDEVKISQAIKPKSLDLIQKKLEGKTLNKQEIKEIIKDIIANSLTESEIAFFVSAVYKSGMTIEETISMIKAIVETGNKLGLKGKIVDKHGVGGIPGRTTPIIVSICSALGLIMPKTSSRAITTPSGTADAMEVICKVDFSINEIKKILKKTKACMVWGGSLNLAPADDKIIQIERLLNLDPESQLLASIMSKKIAVNARYVLIDIPYGKHAKINFNKAKALEKKFKKIAEHFRIKLVCSLNKVQEPLSNGIGPALEIKDVIKVLKRESPCYKLEKRALQLSAKILELTKKCKKGAGLSLARKILDSGLAHKKFKQIVLAQKGRLNSIKEAKFSHNIIAEKNCQIKEINIKKINEMARIAGCPLDKASGIYLHKHLNEKIKKGEKILTLYAESQEELKEALLYYKQNKPIILKNINF